MATKRWVCILLLSALLLCCFPCPATAQSGLCGDNARWSINADGVLTISGTGTMWDWEQKYVDAEMNNRSTAPWWDYAETITKVRIGKGITTIGDYAFYLCKNLISVYIPEGVTSIGEYAFYYCPLKNLTLPEGVTVLKKCAFSNCEELTNISFPDSLTDLGKYAFYGCFDLETLTIPKGVTSINFMTFAYCLGLKEVFIHEDVTFLEEYSFYDCRKLRDIYFLGSAPVLKDKCFKDVNARVYYGCTDETWTEEVRQNYGGNLTWHGHLFENYVYNEDATCTTDGTKTGTCPVCGATNTLPAAGSAGHRYVNGMCHCGSILYGDVSGDGRINMADVAKTFAFVRGKLHKLNNTARKCADVVQDLKINMADVARLFAHATGTNPLSTSTYPS